MFKNDQKIQLLLDHSDSIEFNAQENDGETAFIAACKYGLLRVVELLKEKNLKRNSYNFPLRQNSRPRLAAPIAAGSG